MIAAMAAMLFIVYKLHSGKDKIINDFCFVAFLAFYIKNFIPILKFKSNPTKYAKTIRKESYMPFMIVLFSFIYSSYQMRKKNLEEIIRNSYLKFSKLEEIFKRLIEDFEFNFLKEFLLIFCFRFLHSCMSVSIKLIF
jgi:hypothetical protein